MAPTPQEREPLQDSIPRQENGNRIVISGMSGLYPKSHNVKEFSEILYNKVNPITHEDLRFSYNHPEVVQHTGSVPDLDYFDAQFFKVHFRLSSSMDPMAKKVLEQAYQAIYDAGINPEDLSGKKVGVYIGSCFSEAEKTCFYKAASRSGFGIAGCSKTMFANRISYWLNAKGPSMSIDAACCSSTAALEQAYLALSRGECEAAVVGGTYLCLHPQSSVHYGRIIRLCEDGKTKSFDERADGCAKSEAIIVLFLQKAKDAMRIYAEVLHAQTEFTSLLQAETGPKYGFYRDLNSTTNFFSKFYKEARVPPHAIEYVEAFGSALPEVDKVELQAIEQVFCKNRDKPLLIGSVMSNIGYGEAASGISAITKVLLGYHNGQLAANLHCDQPRKDISALCDGRMRIVRDHQHFDRTYVAVNGLSVTGVNSHVLLHGCFKPKDLDQYATNIPHLVNISARHEEAVKHVLKVLKSNPIDPEQVALLHNIHQKSVSGHLGRGFIILKTDDEQKTVSLCEKADYFDNARRPLWFVYSGMGSQWAGMGTQLMRIPIFAAAIERCRITLEPKGIDIVHIITTKDESIFNNILHSFVGIAAIQIGLTDILHELGLKPDGIIGHSVGELGCAYADGCLTAEEMILSAYYRGLVSVETKLIHGSMAAVGVGYEQVSKLCPPVIEVACHNGPDSSTISGPSDVMREFVATLTAKGIFAKEVPCSNIAYHSRYIADAGPGLLKYLQDAVRTPKVRSERWLSTSVPKDKWDQPLAKSCSAEYLTNNLLNPVLFDETSRLLPNDAVLVEIAPHGLLQAILKRSMPANCKNVPLTRRKHPDNVVLLLEAIGKLYMEGYNSKVQVLYPKVDMPVSTGTPFLSHFVKWAHGEKWPMPVYRSAHRTIAANCNFVLALHDKEHRYLEGHSIRGKTLYPFAASLTLVWDLLAMLSDVPKKNLSVEFSNLQLYSQPVLHDRQQLKLSVAMQRGTGYFEILDDQSKVVTGFIKPIKENNLKKDSAMDEENKVMHLNSEDIYKLLRDRDYFYSGEFRNIACVDESLSDAMLVWRDNWTTFIDGMLQLNALRQSHNAVSQPTNIRRIIIDVEAHIKAIIKSGSSDSNILIRAQVSDKIDNTRCGGVVIENIKFLQLPLFSGTKMILKSLNFVPHYNSGLDVSSILEVYFQIIAENLNMKDITVVGIWNKDKESIMFKKINYVIQNIFGIKVNYKQVSREIAIKNYKFHDVDLILIQNLSTDDNICHHLQKVLPEDIFIVNEEHETLPGLSGFSSMYRVLSVHTSTEKTKLQLLRWGQMRAFPNTTTVSVRKEADLDFLTSAHNNLTTDHHLLVIATYPTPPGLKELISSWRDQTNRNNVKLVTVNNSNDNFIESLPEVNLAFNNVTNGALGSDYYLSLNQKIMENQNMSLKGTQLSDFDSLKWVVIPELTGSGVVNVHYAGINTNDLKQVDGALIFKRNVKNSYGMDYSGITESGIPVMGIVHSGAASKQVKAQPELLWPVPAHWSLEDAATVPLAYVQAFYCLVIKALLPRRKTVFVHGGAGALGQAIISIALSLDCEIFATVSNNHKKNFLLKLFPTLKADHIGCSRDHTFCAMVQILTKGNLCDICISCVKGNLKDLSMRCVSFGGMFYDISQIQNGDHYNFGMSALNQEKNYVSLDFSTIFNAENLDELKIIHRLVSEGIARGYVRPLSRVTYAPHEVSRAFRLLAASSHRGRVLLRLTNNTLQAQYRMSCSADRSSLILCGETEFGVHFADKLITRGATKLYLHVPTQSPYLKYKIRGWQRLGINVVVSSIPLNSQKAVTSLLSSSLQLGRLEGAYIFAEENYADSNLISNLDAEIRKISSDLRYFAVICFGENSAGKNVCLSRLNDKLPASVIMLPEIRHSSYSSSENWRAVVEAAEQALQNHGVTLAHANRHNLSLLQQIAKLAGISIPEDASKSLTLEELGVPNHKVQVLCTFLRIQYNLTFDEEQVLSLTINTILDLERKVISLQYEDTKGLSTFFNYIDSDELLATTELVILPTLVSSASMRDDEFSDEQIKLCILPGMEGHHERFRIFSERLKLPAIVLQPGLDHPHETVFDTARRYTEVLLKKIVIKDKFYLLGYESGINVALEVAAMLEDHGFTGTIFCIGCTPEELRNEVEEQLSSFENEEQLQDGVLRHMYSLMTESDPTVLDQALQNLSTWSLKMDVCVRALLGRVSHSAQYARSLIECALSRINQIRHFNFAPRQLRSQVILLRAAIGHTSLKDSVLQHISKQPLVVYQLNSPLAHTMTDLRCTAIINEHLDPKILEDFAIRNTCDTYLLNAGSFMSVEKNN